MLKKLTLTAVAVAALATASVSMSASADAHAAWKHGKRWNHPHRQCVVKKVWRTHFWVKKTVCRFN
jgi:hypothetical protein